MTDNFIIICFIVIIFLACIDQKMDIVDKINSELFSLNYIRLYNELDRDLYLELVNEFNNELSIDLDNVLNRELLK